MAEQIIMKKNILAICYDFDKTLTPYNMQDQGLIQDMGYDVATFWREVNDFAEQNSMEANLAYMYFMLQKSENIRLDQPTLEAYGGKITLYPGLDGWFDRLNEYGRKRNLQIEHYVISSGLTEMIAGTSLGKAGVFKQIYAGSFYYDETGRAVWPAQILSYTGKTQFLFRISKGVLASNDPAVNSFFPSENLRVPFHNMVYIGDSETDIPCMKLVNSYGGYSIGVYDYQKQNLAVGKKMLKEKRISFLKPSDYRVDQPLDKLLKNIIDLVAARDNID